MKSEKGMVGGGEGFCHRRWRCAERLKSRLLRAKKLLALLRTNWIQIGKLNSDLDGVRPFQTCNLVKEGVRKSSNTCCVMLCASMLLVLAKREL